MAEIGFPAGEGAGDALVAMDEVPPSVRSPVGAAGFGVGLGVAFLRDCFADGEAEGAALLAAVGAGEAISFLLLRFCFGEAMGDALVSAEGDGEVSGFAEGFFSR